jgi:hypothetical protein
LVAGFMAGEYTGAGGGFTVENPPRFRDHSSV